MNTSVISATLHTLATELADGTADTGGFVLNRGDVGLLRSLDRLSAAQASTALHGGATIAAHADHVDYGLSLINRWSAGERNPWADADWGRSWTRTTVTDAEWKAVRDELRAQSRKWVEGMRAAREVADIELNGLIGSVAHLAYHLGAIRQIAAQARGPKESE